MKRLVYDHQNRSDKSGKPDEEELPGKLIREEKDLYPIKSGIDPSGAANYLWDQAAAVERFFLEVLSIQVEYPEGLRMTYNWGEKVCHTKWEPNDPLWMALFGGGDNETYTNTALNRDLYV